MTWPVCEGASSCGRRGDRTKELGATVSDEAFATLEHLAQELGVSLEEQVMRSLAAYVAQARPEPALKPIGFGMWTNPPEM